MSLPDDVAEYLDTHPNSSAIVTKAIRAQMERVATTRAMLAAAGLHVTDEGMAKWRDVLRPPTDEQRAESRRRLDAMRAGHSPEEER